MRPSKIRVAKYEHSATSKWVVEGLKNNKGRRSRKFFHTKAEADLFARDPHAYRSIPHLDPAIRARLESALQRPDLKPTTRAKIEAALDPRKHHLPTVIDGSPEQ